MPRALAAFRHETIDTVPAPTDFQSLGPRLSQSNLLSKMEVVALSLLPDPTSLGRSSAALHEYIGLFGYWLAGWSSFCDGKPL